MVCVDQGSGEVERDETKGLGEHVDGCIQSNFNALVIHDSRPTNDIRDSES